MDLTFLVFFVKIFILKEKKKRRRKKEIGENYFRPPLSFSVEEGGDWKVICSNITNIRHFSMSAQQSPFGHFNLSTIFDWFI
jgi:hypothetical protein